MASNELLTERLLRVIDEGRRTATYKLALLLALMDIVAADPGVEKIPTRVIVSGEGPSMVCGGPASRCSRSGTATQYLGAPRRD